MSHIVTIATKVRDRTAISLACGRLGLTEPAQGTTKLFSGEVSGLLVQLPDWRFPVVIDITSGNVQYDNFEGNWGDPQHLDRFLQMYAVEKTKLECRRTGAMVSEQTLQDGSIKLHISEAA